MVISGLKTNLLRLGSVAACIAMFVSVANATTYYVSNDGNDGNDGTSQATPWQTVAKVNGTTFSAGDQILFNRGDIWRESIVPSSSGAAGNPITYADYGTGNKPTFYGSDVLINANFTGGGGSYTYNVGGGIDANYAYVLQEHVFIGTGPATYNNPNVTVSISTDPRTDGKLYTFCKRANVVASSGQSHIVFRNLIADETVANDGASEGYGMRAEGSTDVLFENCEAYRCGRHNMACINSDQVTFRSCHVAYVAPAISGGSSLYVSYADANLSASSSHSVYEDCIADNQSGYDFYDGHSQDGKPLHVVFLNPTSSESKFYCDSYVGGSYAFTNGTLNAGRIECWCANPIIDGVTFKNTAFIDMWASGATIQNCVWDNVNAGEVAAVLVRSGSANDIICFNTFNLSGNNCMGFYGSASGLKFYGNIMIGTPTYQGSASDVSYADYNFYGSTPGTIMGQSWAAWTGGGKDAHAKTGDPLFTNPGAGDYSLQAASPCIDAGGGNPVPATDILGGARPHGSAPDMGAYEYGSAPPQQGPVITSATTVNGKVGVAFSYQITASGSPTNFNATGLPAGLSINRNTGVISGTPTATGTSSVTISASNSGGTGQATLTITITVPAPVITSATSVTGLLNQAFSYQITASGSPTNYNAQGLPAGLTVNRSTGLISGMPTVIGTNSVTISALNPGGKGQATLRLVIRQQPVPGSLSGSGVAGGTATIDLTAEGWEDWAHWGYSSTNIDHKAVSGKVVKDITETHVGSPVRYTNNVSGYSWSDGKPTASAVATKTGIRITGVGKSFSITVPADTTSRTVKLYVGGSSSAGTLTAHLSDDSAADYTDSSFSNPSATYDAVYTIAYKAGLAGQNLTITWQMASGTGSVTLQAATLQSAASEVIRFVPAGMSLGSSGCRLTWLGAASSTNDFKMYRRTDLRTGSWQLVAPDITRSGTGTNTWTDPSVFQKAFYRVDTPN